MCGERKRSGLRAACDRIGERPEAEYSKKSVRAESFERSFAACLIADCNSHLHISCALSIMRSPKVRSG